MENFIFIQCVHELILTNISDNRPKTFKTFINTVFLYPSVRSNSLTSSMVLINPFMHVEMLKIGL